MYEIITISVFFFFLAKVDEPRYELSVKQTLYKMVIQKLNCPDKV
jgi:hypothetical protein